MPEDTRVQQQVHMHIWMEADIIMAILSDARRGCQDDAPFTWTQILDVRKQKNHCSRRVVSAGGIVEPRAIRESGAIRRANTTPS
jgi:hypothetical protein